MKYQKNLNDNRVQCTICPRNCILKENQEGFCHIRKNAGGEIVLTSYGYNTGLAIDPVEKKPLYHFYPGSSVLSFGTLGCNMGCQFCQNWKTTKNRGSNKFLNKASPAEIVETAKYYACKSVAFTYNDPIAFFEYAVDTAKLCRENGIKTIAVTSGFINPEPAKEFFKYMDAANIDLKGFSENFYKKNCLAHIKPVLDTIKYVKNETDCWLELTTMLIEGENNSDEDIKSECSWIAENLGELVPLHFSAFFPSYRFMDREATAFPALLRAYEIAQNSGLKYVYTGNLTSRSTSATYCKNCHRPVIIRNGYGLLEYNLDGENCIFCGTKCDGRF
ncbi:radical SAM domain protein [Brachyspira sp. CAG:484]|nr:radical SAM domain protein [Brachyspira sp. CAG:484]